MSFETGDKQILEFCGRGPKSYALRLEDPTSENQSEIKKIKGVKKVNIKKDITFDDFKSGEEKRVETVHMRAFDQKMYTVQFNKKALGTKDTKRIRTNEKYRTLALGHYSLTEK